MHADGGTRLILFFNRYVEAQRALVDARAAAPAPRLDIIVNSEMTLAPTCTKNSLIGIGKRSFAILQDQHGLDGLYRTVVEAERAGFETRQVTAEGSGCVPPGDLADRFQPAFLRCLFDHGERLGGGQTPWRSGPESVPGDDFGASVNRSSACSTG
jgi:hypothetical protein